MGQGRHRGGERPDPRLVVRGQRTGPPGVVVRGGEPRQQQSPGGELESEESGRTPEGGRVGGMCREPGTRQYRQRVADREQPCRYAVHPCVGADDGQLRHAAGAVRRAAAVRMPEGDAAGASGIPGQEDHGAGGECGDLGERCRRESLHSDAEFLKFD